jgi:transcriptional regulator GlxA family with amidase domain
MRLKAGILLFPEVEALDFCGPYEVFTATRLDEERRREESSPFEVILIAEDDRPVLAAGGLRVLPDCHLDSCPLLQVLVVPGGWGVRQQIKNKRLLRWLRERSDQVEILASVCTGSMLLGHAGLLEGLSATTHRSAIEWMRSSFPGLKVVGDRRVVDEGRIVTAAGIAAGIDMALHLVGRFFGPDVVVATARHMEYPVPQDGV